MYYVQIYSAPQIKNPDSEHECQKLSPGNRGIHAGLAGVDWGLRAKRGLPKDSELKGDLNLLNLSTKQEPPGTVTVILVEAELVNVTINSDYLL